MKNISATINKRFFDDERPAVQNILAIAILAILVAAFIVYGSTLPVYTLFILLAALFIMPTYHYLGLILIVMLTMLFEKFFTLQPLFWDNAIYKLS